MFKVLDIFIAKLIETERIGNGTLEYEKSTKVVGSKPSHFQKTNDRVITNSKIENYRKLILAQCF